MSGLFRLGIGLPQDARAFTGPILLGILAGVVARAYLLRSDYRQFPSHPHGRINYLFLGFLAATFGALAAPVILTASYGAVVFLAIGAASFHTVRDMERQMLQSLERDELVPRGNAYIEGMAMAFETRNYLVLLIAMLVTTAAILLPAWAVAPTALLLIWVARLFMQGPFLHSIADVEPAPVEVDGGRVRVAGIEVLRLAAGDDWNRARTEGLGLLIRPRNLNDRITLTSAGQRQAILHDLAVRLGVRAAAGDSGLLPRAALDPPTGIVAVFLVPEIRDVDAAVRVAQGVPVLETTRHVPLPAHWLQERRGSGEDRGDRVGTVEHPLRPRRGLRE